MIKKKGISKERAKQIKQERRTLKSRLCCQLSRETRKRRETAGGKEQATSERHLLATSEIGGQQKRAQGTDQQAQPVNGHLCTHEERRGRIRQDENRKGGTRKIKQQQA